MRIGSLSDPELVNTNYRVYQPLGALARRGHDLRMHHRDRPLDPAELWECDVVHIHRSTSAEVQALARRLHDAGIGIVWDNDDDVAALPRDNPNYRKLGPAGRRAMVEGVARMVRLADVVTTPSTLLAERFRELGAADVRVLENRLPRDFIGAGRVAHQGVVIACLAGLEHRFDYQQLGLEGVLARLLDAHPDLRVLTIGHGMGLPVERVEHVPLVLFPQLVRTLARADIGIAPLVEIPWNRARSNVKLKEYAAAGLAWLASPVGPYLGLGEPHGGRLVPDDGWHDALERLILNARERRKLAKRGAKWVKREAIDLHAKEWEAALRDAAARASAGLPTRTPAGAGAA